MLKNVRPGDPVEIERPDGEWARYRVTETAFADARLPWYPPEDADGIALVTCYPFDAVVPGGPLRFLVMAEPVY